MSDAPDVIVSTDRERVRDVSLGEPDPLKGGDVYKWAMEQVALIRDGQLDKLDWINIADEIESVGKSEFRSLASHLEIVLLHMLKWDHQRQRRGRSWANSIREHRKRVTRDLSASPSLKPRINEAIEEAYELAILVAANETGLETGEFPTACPYDWDAIMTRPFVVDQTGETA